MKTRRNRIYRMKKQARNYFSATCSPFYKSEVWADRVWRVIHPDTARQIIHLWDNR